MTRTFNYILTVLTFINLGFREKTLEKKFHDPKAIALLKGMRARYQKAGICNDNTVWKMRFAGFSYRSSSESSSCGRHQVSFPGIKRYSHIFTVKNGIKSSENSRICRTAFSNPLYKYETYNNKWPRNNIVDYRGKDIPCDCSTHLGPQNAEGSKCLGFRLLQEHHDWYLFNPLWNIFQGKKYRDAQGILWNDYRSIICLHKGAYQLYERVILIGESMIVKLEIDSETHELKSYSIQGSLGTEYSDVNCYIEIRELVIGLQINDTFFEFDPQNPPEIEWDSSFRY